MGRRSRRSCKSEAPPAPAGKVMLKPSEEEVLAAVLSLYADKLKPYGRILRKRCGERALAASAASVRSSQALPEDVSARGQRGESETSGCAAELEVPDVDPKHLKTVCESCERVWIEEEEGAEWAALLPREHPEDVFVDIYSSQDPFSEAFWSEAGKYLTALEEGDVLPGGRYACAQELQRRGLPFLVELSLGEACHFVQLALTQRRLLGYLCGNLVPYECSQSKAKEQCAAENQACSSAPEFPAADWETARRCLQTLIQDSAGLVSVSNVKRLFRSRFELELSETLLGHSKLTSLLMDERLRGVCAVQLHGHGHAVVEACAEPPREAQALSVGPSLSVEVLSIEDLDWAREGDEVDREPRSRNEVKNTFVHVEGPESPGNGSLGRKRSHSLPAREPRSWLAEPEQDEPEALESPDFCGLHKAFCWNVSGLDCDRCDSVASTASFLPHESDSEAGESWAGSDGERAMALQVGQGWSGPSGPSLPWIQPESFWMAPHCQYEALGSWEHQVPSVWPQKTKISLADCVEPSDVVQSFAPSFAPPPPPPARPLCGAEA